MSEFIWDKGNRKHATQHGVSVQEIEEVFRRNPVIAPHEAAEGDEEDQFRAYGTTMKGRYVTVTFMIRGSDVRPIASWPMTPIELETYAEEIHVYPPEDETETH